MSSPFPSQLPTYLHRQQFVGEDHRCRDKSRKNGRLGAGKSALRVSLLLSFRHLQTTMAACCLAICSSVLWFLCKYKYGAINIIDRPPQLRELHGQGYSLLSIDATGQTALHYAARYGHKDIVRYLISYAPKTIINMLDNETWVRGPGQERDCCFWVFWE